MFWYIWKKNPGFSKNKSFQTSLEQKKISFVHRAPFMTLEKSNLKILKLYSTCMCHMNDNHLGGDFFFLQEISYLVEKSFQNEDE